ncbi:DinB family protein [Thalassotalea sp. SU-HH00458]|uniref:DinB family protein n=1 Tax=Thalassotalea sp. SU-HH00458 TaxID=3127657 RepID=UPI0033653D85
MNNFKMMSLYNQRINRQLMHCCLPLSVEILEQDSHSFFTNIMSYWNHLLFGDLVLLTRLAQHNIGQLTLADFTRFPAPISPQDIYYQELTQLNTCRQALDELIICFCQNLTEQACEQVISYTTTEGVLLTKKVADIVQHLFNHQTHHRGQLTCLLSQNGVDYACMDLPVIVPEGSHC